MPKEIKVMLKCTLMAGSLGLVVLALPLEAEAQYGYGYGDGPVRNTQCERERADDSAAGTIVGALAGALIGGAIGNEIADDNGGHGHRGYRGGHGRGHYGRGYYGGGHGYKDSNDAEVITGALLGAVIGGAAGNSIAKSTGPECQVAYAPYSYSSAPAGSIPRSTDGLYGGPEVFGGNDPREPYPSRYPSTPSYPSYPDYPSDAGYREPGRDCRVIQRETRLPDGQVERDPVTACWDERTREWRVQDGYSDDRYGY
jgi:hypothetical protein